MPRKETLQSDEPRGRTSVPWLALLLSTLATLYWFLGDPALLEFEREAVEGGAWWRLLSAHLVHYGPTHALGDILGFVVWAACIEWFSRRLLVLGLLISAAFVGAGVYLACPRVNHFAGLSGVAVGLVVILAGIAWDRAKSASLPYLRPLVVLVLLAIFAKTGYEFWSGHAILAPELGTGTRILPEAHVFGAIGGLVTVGVGYLWRRKDWRAAG